MPGPEPPLPSFDLYRELELDPAASPETIEAAWRSLAKHHHPDADPTIGPDRIRRINVAHDWLSDPALRARYDARYMQRPSRAAPYQHSSVKPPVSVDRQLPKGSTAPGISPGRIAAYTAWCLASVVVAYVVSVVAAVLLSATNVSAIVAVLLGHDGTVTVIRLVGNLVFAGVLGYLAATAFIATFRAREDDFTLVIVGALAALAMTFGFPAFATSYMTGLADWMTTDGAGIPAVALISAIEAAFVGLVVAGAAWARRSS